VRISVVTVAYRAAATIADTCRSVAAQDWPEVEHIVIDGGSGDGTAEIVAATARPGHVFVSEPDKGLYDAMNKGLARATGDLIGFLNADDFLCRSDALSLVGHAAAQHPAADAVSGAVAIVRADNTAKLIRAYAPTPFAPWMLRFAHMPPHPGFYTRAAAMKRVGAFDPSIRVGADFDWMVRFFAVHHLHAAPLRQTLVTMRSGGVSNEGLASRRRIAAEALTTLKRHGLVALPPLVWAKYAAKAGQLVARPVEWPAPPPVRITAIPS
jgi:glycosyltransferase involved in cell wall biosynthesis